MSDQQQTEATEADDQQDQDLEQQEPEQEPEQELTDEEQSLVKKAGDEAKKYRLRMKEAEAERDELRQQLEALQQRVDDSEALTKREQMMNRISEQTGVTPDVINSLRGDTEQELTAAAERISEAMRPEYPAIPGQHKQPSDPPAESGFLAAFKPKAM